MRCSNRAPSFGCEQSASIPLILQESADATYTQPRHPPPPLFLHIIFVAMRENIFGSSRESNQGFRGGGLTSQPPCYILLMLCYKFHRCHHHSPGLPFPFAAQDNCLCPTMPQYLAKSIHYVDRADTFDKVWWDAPLALRDLAMSNLHIFRWLETEHWPEMGLTVDEFSYLKWQKIYLNGKSKNEFIDISPLFSKLWAV